MQRDPVTLDLHLIAGTENFGGLSTDGSTHAPTWLPHRGVIWSRNPDTSYVGPITVTIPSSIAETHASLWGRE
jgi:hypothetical protein